MSCNPIEVNDMSEVAETLIFDGELNAIIKEHLEVNGFQKTYSIFIEECQDKNKTINKIPTKKESEKLETVSNKLMDLFESGSRDKFFELWCKYVSEKLRTRNKICQKLEFILYIYFAIFPMLQKCEDKNVLEESMAYFKRFLETRGAVLSQTTEFLPYYALPFIPNPSQHPSFQELFEETWVPELRRKLEKFLFLTLKSPTDSSSYLTDIYKKITKGKEEIDKKVMQLQQKLNESDTKALTCQTKFEQLRRDYENLVGITAELVDTLDLSLRGTLVSPEYLKSICTRLLPNEPQEISLNDETDSPGAALRASIAQSLSHSIDVPLLPSLDYDKIKQDLISASDRSKILLLQALRWRLTKSLPGQQRNTVMNAYINHDLLDCANSDPENNIVTGLLNSLNDGIKQYIARFINSVASLAEGRLYISQSPLLVLECLKCMKNENKESLTRENLLGALQKLSLRRHLQSLMIENNTIEWLIALLEDNDSLSDYMLEYSTALLMNLCLRTAGKLKCTGHAEHILKVVSDLLGSDRPEVIRFVNGTLYSILCVPTIRQEAKRMGLEEALTYFLKDYEHELQRQIQYVIKKLNSDEVEQLEPSDDEDDDEEEDDENQDAMEADLDKNEIIISKPGELIGEKLLSMEYLGFMTNSIGKPRNKQLEQVQNADEPIQRPITPKSRILEGEITAVQNRGASSVVSPQSRPTTREQKKDLEATFISPQSRPATREQKKDNENIIKPLQRLSSAKEHQMRTEIDNDQPKSIENNYSKTLNNDVATTVRCKSFPAITKNVNNFSPFQSRPKVPRTPDISTSGNRMPVMQRSASPRPRTPSSRPTSSSAKPLLEEAPLSPTNRIVSAQNLQK